MSSLATIKSRGRDFRYCRRTTHGHAVIDQIQREAAAWSPDKHSSIRVTIYAAMILGVNQTQLAEALGTYQSEVSHRWWQRELPIHRDELRAAEEISERMSRENERRAA